MSASEPLGDRDSAGRAVVGTIVARNYIAYAAVLAASVRSTNAHLDFVTLVVDGQDSDRARTELGRVVLPGDLGLPPEQLEPMTVMYTVMELSTGLKPAFLRHLLRSGSGYDVAAYLDPDVMVVGSLDGAVEAARRSAIALTPHVLTPMPRDGLEIAERAVMRSGIFNLGFIAVGPRSGPFLDWWHERLTTDAVVDFSEALFTDQRWVDWVPALFEHTVLRDPGLNVAYWNAHERPLTLDGNGRVLADGSPLVFVHFSGFEASRPWALSRFTGRNPRALVSESPVLADLCIDYAKRLEAANNDEHRLSAYGFATVGGVAPLTPAVRTVYRGSVLGELPFEGAPTLPHSRPESFARWLHRPVRPTPWTTLTPAEYAHWLATPDLQAAAPHPLSHSAHELRRRISMLHAETLDAVDRVVRVDEGWTVLAGGSAEPTSEARRVAQRVADALRRGPLPVDLLDPHRVGQGRDVRWAGADEVAGERILGNLVMCIDPRRVILAELALQLEGCPGLRIGVWLGSDDLDLVWQAESINAFDEIWTLSATQGERIADGSEVRVRRLAMPLPEAIAPPRPVGSSAAQVVAFELDPRVPASAQRLDVALEAYRRAVPAGTGHRIEVRTGHTALARADLELVHHLAMARPDIHVVDDEAGSSRPVDVLLAINPAAATGLAAQAALARGSLVVTSEPGPGILSGRDVGVVRARLDGSHEEQVAALAEALASALDGGPAPSAAHDVEVTGSDVLALATAALREGRRPRRGVASHGSGLEAEVRRLRQESAHLRAELTALEGTKVFRYTRAARSAYGALLASFRSRARRRRWVR